MGAADLGRGRVLNIRPSPSLGTSFRQVTYRRFRASNFVLPIGYSGSEGGKTVTTHVRCAPSIRIVNVEVPVITPTMETVRGPVALTPSTFGLLEETETDCDAAVVGTSHLSRGVT